MKQILILSLLFLFCLNTFGQQEPLYSQYNNNHFLINPAAAGRTEHAELRLTHRTMFSFAFPGAPKTSTLTLHGRFKKIGLGLMAFSDVTGPTSRMGAQFSYAFHMNLWGDYDLSLGLAGKLLRYQLDLDRITLVNVGDDAINQVKDGVTQADASFGAYLSDGKMYVGLSAPNLIQTKLDFGIETPEGLPISRLYRHYFVVAGYRLKFGTIGIEPSMMLKKVQAVPFQFDVNLKASFMNDVLTVGAAYRNINAMNLMFGVCIEERFHVMYSMDFGIGKPKTLASPVNTSSEIIVGIDIYRKNRQSKNLKEWDTMEEE